MMENIVLIHHGNISAKVKRCLELMYTQTSNHTPFPLGRDETKFGSIKLRWESRLTKEKYYWENKAKNKQL